MLILTRNIGQRIMIGDDIEITILDIQGSQARIGVIAPSNVPVDREEIYLKKKIKKAAKTHIGTLTASAEVVRDDQQ